MQAMATGDTEDMVKEILTEYAAPVTKYLNQH